MNGKVILSLAVIGPLSISIVLVLFVTEANAATRVLFSGLAVAVVTLTLWHALILSRRSSAGVSSTDCRLMQAHIIAHVVPVSFGMAALFTGATGALAPVWNVGFALFFYTGRKTWLALQAVHPSPLYYVFLRGNTAMLITSISLALLVALTAHTGLALFAERMLQFYVAVHLSLLTPAVAKLHRDITG